MTMTKQLVSIFSLALALNACGGDKPADNKATGTDQALAPVELLNVSYDPTRELYEQYNKEFSAFWKKTKNQDVTIRQSHGGSGKQARSVIDGLEADVVTLALAFDVDALYEQGQLIPKDWQGQFPDKSAPYTSTIVFITREGNPKGIKDWSDLVKPGVAVITPNPKTSGGARWTYLAAWGYARKQPGGSDATAKAFVKKLYGNVKVLDSGARGSTTTFVQNGIGDVLLSWENEAALILKESGADKFDVIAPPTSILAEPPVAVVEKNVKRHGTSEVAKAYLEHLYSPEGQEIAAKNFYRPRNSEAAKKYEKNFPAIELFTIDQEFGGWAKAQKEHFVDGASFDQIYAEPGK
jgi:sulfate/thiosulfate transport system substrate-binding protein